MAEQLAKVYDPQTVEKQVNELWMSQPYFHPNAGDNHQKAYTIVIPPPNVTAPLHLGHALNNTLQDVLIRFRRMQQYQTLWMPGTDHAGIATQTVVEKRILAEEGKRRTDFARGDFVARVQAWKDEYEATILRQLKAMGCSCDWQRTRFTMDDVCAKAVRETFFRLFKDGLIYRGKRLVNWDPATQTVLADDEVEHETIQGHFWYLRYPLTEEMTIGGKRIEHVTVATTRPETMLGDTAVAMNPADPRAKYLVGKRVRLPIVGRVIPIIADEHVVLPNPESEDEKARFSTGFLKVTPAHDPDDWEIGQRHGLPVINIMAPDGSISDKHGWDDATAPEAQNLIGMDRFEAREAIVEWFREEGLLEEVRDYSHEVGHSYRSHVPIEPYLSDQWYIAVKRPIADCRLRIADWIATHQELIAKKDDVGYLRGTDVPVSSLAGLALAPLLDGRLRFIPERYAKTYQTWLENLRDWPISRQLWWGHQIPVWRVVMDSPDRPLSEEDNYTRQCEERLNELAHSAGLENNSFAYQSARVLSEVYVCAHTPKGNDLLRSLREVVTKKAATKVKSGQATPLSPSRPDGFPSASEDLTYRFECVVHSIEQDPDVLDTWFSSALWPFSTMGWPDQTAEMKTFYPGNVLCTAREIITLWVSRMVMMGQYCAGDIPFSDVYIHAMIQDGEGRKMSKSLGNGIDPLIAIDSHGADAMRFTLASMTTDTQDIRMPVAPMTLPDGRQVNTSPKFDIGRNFCNKLWNASRFAMMNLEGFDSSAFDPARLDVTDRWILSRLAATISEVTAALESFKFSEPLSVLYRFFWNDLCDWYLEWVKSRFRDPAQKPIAQGVLAFALDCTLRLLHPFVPFITEGIFQKLNELCPVRSLKGIAEAEGAAAITVAQWPAAMDRLADTSVEEQIRLIQDVVRAVRDIRSRYNRLPNEPMIASASAPELQASVLNLHSSLVCQLAALEQFHAAADLAKPNNAALAVVEDVHVYVHDVIDRQAERLRLEKQRQEIERAKKTVESKLANANFVTKAKPEVVAQTRERLTQLQEQLQTVAKHLAEIGE